jgi:hypothetical protein
MLNLQVVLILSVLGLRRSAASTVRHIRRDVRCEIHHLKQHDDFTTKDAARPFAAAREFRNIRDRERFGSTVERAA